MTQGTQSVGFFTPVTFPKHWGDDITCKESFIEFVDDFFYLGGSKVVATGADQNEINYDVEILTDQSPSCWAVALKVAAYFTLVLPLILLLAKVIIRCVHTFEIPQSRPATPDLDALAEVCAKYNLGDADSPWFESLPAISTDEPYSLTWREAIEFVSALVQSAKRSGLEEYVIGTRLTRPADHASLDDLGNTQYKIKVMHQIFGCVPQALTGRAHNMLEVVLRILIGEKEIVSFERDQDSSGHDVYTLTLTEEPAASDNEAEGDLTDTDAADEV